MTLRGLPEAMRHVTAFLVILVSLGLLSLGLEGLRGGLGAVVLTSQPGKGGMLAFNVTVVVQAASYLLFLWAMDRVLYRPMLEHLDRRNQETSEAEEVAEEAGRAARRSRRERDEKLAEAFQEVSRDRVQVKAAAVAEYQAVVSQARTEADGLVEESRRQLEAEAAAAERELEAQVGDFAVLIRGKLLGEEGAHER